MDRNSRNYGIQKRTKFVFDSSIDWNPEKSAKIRCNLVCLRSFQVEAGCIVLNL